MLPPPPHCQVKLELCVFAIKGEHNVYSLVPKIPVCTDILTKSEFISSCSRPAVSSNIVQITRATFFVNVVFKWPPAAILDVQKSLLVAFLTISDRYFFLWFFFHKMATGGHFGCPKIAFNHISNISNQYIILDKMAASCHFGWDDIVNYRTRPIYLDE